MTVQLPRFGVRFQGYDRAEVHRMVDRIERTLAGEASSDAVSIMELQSAHFDIRIRGYDKREVRAYLSSAIHTLRLQAQEAA